MKTRLRRGFFLLHLWLGLGLGLYMSLLGLTGAVLVWKAPLERALYPQLFVAAPDALLAPPSRFMEAVHLARPEARINRIHLPEEPGNTVEVRFTSGDETYFAYLDPQSARLRGIVTAQATLTGWILELHASLLLKNGRLLNTIGAVGGCLVLLSGLWLWWPSLRRFGSDLKQRLSIKRGASTRRLIHDLHNVFGIYSLALLLLLFSTGAALLDLSEPLKNLVYRVTNTPLDPELAPLTPTSRAPQSVDALFQAADKALPNSKTTHLFPPKKSGAAFRAVVRDPRSAEHSGIAQISVDPATGRVVQIIDERQPTGGKKILALITPLHYAELGGFVMRLLYTFAGLMPTALFLTGFLKWNEKRRGKARNRARHGARPPEQESVGVAAS